MTNNEIIIWARGIFDARFINFQYALMKKKKYEINMDANLTTEEKKKIIV